jgi:NAD+ diphosphatase
MSFVADYKTDTEISGKSYWIAFINDEVLLKPVENSLIVPVASDFSDLSILPLHLQFLGYLGGHDCYSAELQEASPIPDGIKTYSLRSLLGLVSDEMFALIGRAFQVMDWDRSHQYCGACGSATEIKKDERARKCPKCGLVFYPRISPAVIAAIVKDGKLLMARGTRFKTNMYSVLAGFVESGETLEECLHREVMEEVGIKIKNIKYFGNQPWPFPNSLMVGFTAEYESGEINIDSNEIIDAEWFAPDEILSLPSIAGKYSIAGKLISWFLEK